jgi:hypothetical protein
VSPLFLILQQGTLGLSPQTGLSANKSHGISLIETASGQRERYKPCSPMGPTAVKVAARTLSHLLTVRDLIEFSF